ncbi:MAG: hypothetical protein JW384_01969 [Nitrosomonadaceae bacterium]|nr:hypothetical protein [Nitrosomonadaceae bacterium]
MVCITELTLERNDAHAPPCTVVHAVDRRQVITAESHLPHDLELLLVLEETTRLNQILTGKLLHATGIELLILVRLTHMNETPALRHNDVRIRCTGLRALPCQNGRLNGCLIIAENHRH